VARYPDLTEMAKFATENYAKIDSIDAIRPPYPAHGTANWWALRKRYEELLFARICKERAASKHRTSINEPEAEAAKWAALGNETADRDYRDFAKGDLTAPDARLTRRNWLDAAVDAARKLP